MCKKILLTGATGFVGRQILNNLLDKKVKVKAIIREGKKDILPKDKKNSKIEFVTTKDLFKEDEDWWTEQCKDIDTIIHAAWYVETGKYLNSLKNLDCLLGSLQLAKGAINAGTKRFVGIGTCFEYDFSKGNLSVKTSLDPKTPYAAAKVGLYKFLSQMLPAKSIEFSWCRLFYMYGEGEDERRLFPFIHKKLSKGEPVELSNGKQIRDFLEVSEVGKIITDISLSNKCGPINICSGVPLSVRQFAEKIADEYGRRDLLKFGARQDNLIDPPFIVGLPNYNY
jgi:dTDP-6-deoxy-L-talose 4-dehydrogenase (NAD+)